MKKSKPLTIRQQIQQCPTLTPEERSLALFGLNKARVLPIYKDWELMRKKNPNRLLHAFEWGDVTVIKGQSYEQAHKFWWNIYRKLQDWKCNLTLAA